MAPDLLPAFLAAGPTAGLMGLAAFIGRAGRMVGAGLVAGGGPLAMMVVEVAGVGPLGQSAVALAAAALRGELRFDDPVAQVTPTVFAAVVPLVPGGSDGDQVQERLAQAVRSSLADPVVWSPLADPGTEVRAAHVVAGPAESADADELLRSAVALLRVG